MAIVYFDSSAFVKLVVDENGSDVAAMLWDACDAAVSSRLAYPEVRAALAAAGRSGRLTPADQRRAEAAWQEYWEACRAVELTGLVAARAGEPFYTTRPAGAGFGLGLFLVRTFADQWGGRFQLSSTAGSGTTVTLDLPAERS